MKMQSNMLAVAGLVAMGIASSANASLITVTGSAGSRAASATFDATGSTLTVTLTNTSSSDVLVPSDVLTGVYWDLPGALLSLTRVSAVLNTGSVVWFGTTDPGNVIGGEFAYKAGISGPASSRYGISSAGLGLFGSGDVFPGSNLQGPADPDGIQYGITSVGDNTATGNAAVTGSNALIQSSVVLTLTGLPAGFDPNTMTNFSFQYGTALSEPNVPGTPAPGSAALIGGGAAVMLRRRRR